MPRPGGLPRLLHRRMATSSPSPTLTQAAAGRAVRSCSGSCGPQPLFVGGQMPQCSFTEAEVRALRSISAGRMAAERTRLPFIAPAASSSIHRGGRSIRTGRRLFCVGKVIPTRPVGQTFSNLISPKLANQSRKPEGGIVGEILEREVPGPQNLGFCHRIATKSRSCTVNRIFCRAAKQDREASLAVKPSASRIRPAYGKNGNRIGSRIMATTVETRINGRPARV